MRLASLAAVALLFSTADSVQAAIIPYTFIAPETLDFESVSTPADVASGDPLFTDFGISSVVSSDSTTVSAPGGFGGTSKALVAENGDLFVLDTGDSTTANDRTFTLTFAESHLAFGLSFHQLATLAGNDNVSLDFIDTGSGSSVGSIEFEAANSTFYGFRSTSGAFDQVEISGILMDQGGLGIDNLTFESAAAIPEPSSLVLCGVGVAGLGMGAYRRRRQKKNA